MIDPAELETAETDPVELTRSEVVEVFTEWDRRFREDPHAFELDVERFTRGQTVEEYGDAATATFLGYLGEIRADR